MKVIDHSQYPLYADILRNLPKDVNHWRCIFYYDLVDMVHPDQRGVWLLESIASTIRHRSDEVEEIGAEAERLLLRMACSEFMYWLEDHPSPLAIQVLPASVLQRIERLSFPDKVMLFYEVLCDYRTAMNVARNPALLAK